MDYASENIEHLLCFYEKDLLAICKLNKEIGSEIFKTAAQRALFTQSEPKGFVGMLMQLGGHSDPIYLLKSEEKEAVQRAQLEDQNVQWTIEGLKDNFYKESDVFVHEGLEWSCFVWRHHNRI